MRTPAKPRVLLTPTRVRHIVSHQVGHAVEYNNNDDAPGYWVYWDGESVGANWFSVDQLEPERAAKEQP